MINCHRCGKETSSHKMSYFNTQEICDSCDREERAHPDFGKAQDAEFEEIKKGNLNYKGIGLPDDLKAKYEKAKT